MASNTGSSNYTFRAEPKAVKNRAKYRNKDDYQLQGSKNNNLMNDKRIVRGSTFARKAQKTVETTQPAHAKRRNVPQTQEEIPRASTPDPVAGRHHMQVQTDNYLEDLREKVQEHDFGTQTDPELDFPTKPMFNPTSSGLDMYTFIEEGDLFDFDMEVEPVLNVLSSKNLNQALLEVLEEEEMKEMLRYREAHNQERNDKLAELQQLEAKDQRFEDEKTRRLAQAQERLYQQGQRARQQAAKTVAKDFFNELSKQMLSKIAATGHFYDPTLREITSSFMPWLVKQVGVKVDEYGQARSVVDSFIDIAQHKANQQRAYKLMAINDEMVIERAEEKEAKENAIREREEAAAAAAAAAAAVAAKAARKAAAGDDEGDEGDDEGDEDGDGYGDENKDEDEDEGEGEGEVKAPKEEEKQQEIRLSKIRNTIIRNAFELGEEECLRKHRGQFGKPSSHNINKIFGVPAEMAGETQNLESIVSDVTLKDPTMPEGEILASLGVECQAFTGKGVYVKSVTAMGAAAHASLCKGDVIVTVDSLPIDTPSDYLTIEKNLELGKIINVEVVRGFDGRSEVLKVEVFSSDFEDYGPMHVRTTRTSMSLAKSSQVIYSTPADALQRLAYMVAHLGITHRTDNSKDIHKGGPADRAGVVGSDIVKSIDGVVVDEANSLSDALKKCRAGDWVKVVLSDEEGVDKSVELELAAAGETVEGVRALRHMAGVVAEQVLSAKGCNDDMRIETSAVEEVVAALVGQVVDEVTLSLDALDQLQNMDSELGFVPAIAKNGVKVTEIEASSIVVQSTLAAGDVITHLDDQAVDIETVYNFVEGRMPGEVIKVKCIRAFDGREDIFGLELPAMAGSADASRVRELRELACLPVNATPILTKESAASALRDLPILAGLKIVPGDGFVSITHVHSGTTAFRSEAQVGDRIKKVNGQPVTTVPDFQAAVKELMPGDTITYEVERGQESKILSYGCEMGVGRGHKNFRHEFVWALRVVAGVPVFKGKVASR